jgi:hypothetical protein
MQTGCTYSQAFTFTIAVAHCLIECLSHTPSIIMEQASGTKIALTVNGKFFPFILTAVWFQAPAQQTVHF